MFSRSCNILCIKKKEISRPSTIVIRYTEPRFFWHLIFLFHRIKGFVLNSPARQIIQRSFLDEKDLWNERFDGRLKTNERERKKKRGEFDDEKEKKKKRNHDNVSHSKCFLPLKRMIFFLSVTLSTIEVAHDQDSTVLITEPRVSFGLQPAMRINDAMSRMHGHSYRTLRTASTIVNAASFAFIPLIISFG